MKFLFLAISLVTFLIEIPDDKKKIIWNQNYQLEWTDFKGKVDQKSDYGAITSSGISTSYEFKKDSILFKVIAVFYKQDSWTKESLQSELGLKHEQVHFDITEIAARRLRKRLREEVFHREDVVEKFKSIKKEILNEKQESSLFCHSYRRR